MSEQLTAAVRAAEELNQTVRDKVAEIDAELESKSADVLSRAEVQGDGSVGSTVINAASIFNASSGYAYLHIRLPFSVRSDTGMFHLHVRGYAYGESKSVDVTAVGYCYRPDGALINKHVSGTHSPYLYVGSDGNVYLRLYITNTYYFTAVVDATRVGNGRLIGRGEIEMSLSTNSTI